MANRRYQAGRRLEYKIRDHYRQRGWVVLRSAGSKSAYDLVAVHKSGGCPHFIQAKRLAKGTEVDARRLWKAFRTNLPVVPSSHYSQHLWVQVGRDTYQYAV